MPLIISGVSKTLHSLNGADVVHLRKGEQIFLTRPLYEAYVKQYDIPELVGEEKAEPKPKAKAGKQTEDPAVRAARLDSIGQVILEIQDEGKESDFTASGEIRLSILTERAGFPVNGEDRDAALALLNA